MSAEYCMKKFLEDNSIEDVEVGSAGCIAKWELSDPATLKALTELGIDASGHKQRKIDKRMVNRADLIIAMAQDHHDYIAQHFAKIAPLFLDVAYGYDESIWDREDVNMEDERYCKETVMKIHDAIPNVYKNMGKFL